jgi:hypothetical protein
LGCVMPSGCFSRSLRRVSAVQMKRGLKHRATFKSSWYLFASLQLQSEINQ